MYRHLCWCMAICGVVSMLSELYVAESKSQVYGALHDYIQRNHTHLDEISTLMHICTNYIHVG